MTVDSVPNAFFSHRDDPLHSRFHFNLLVIKNHCTDNWGWVWRVFRLRALELFFRFLLVSEERFL